MPLNFVLTLEFESKDLLGVNIYCYQFYFQHNGMQNISILHDFIFFVSVKDTGKRNCTYIKYFTVNDDRDGIPQTDAILCKYMEY